MELNGALCAEEKFFIKKPQLGVVFAQELAVGLPSHHVSNY